jgi:hypothetical protein
MDLHPSLEAIAGWVGKWEGNGRGDYPTIEAFEYREKIGFQAPPGKPFLVYRQHTEDLGGAPLHSEAGYLRLTAEGPELVIAQPTGLIEMHTGRLDGTTLEFHSKAVVATPTAKPVSEVVRRITVQNDTLSYTLDMAFRHVPLTRHLEANLTRVTTSSGRRRFTVDGNPADS